MRTDYRLGMIALIVSPLAVAAPALKERPQPSPIVGEWEVMKGSASGPVGVVAFGGGSSHYSFMANGRWKDSGNWKDDSGNGSGLYTIDPKPVPPTIQLSRSADGPEGGPEAKYSGTFQVEGDTLTLTLPVQTGGASSTTTLRRERKD